jgi:hypothetical protein
VNLISLGADSVGLVLRLLLLALRRSLRLRDVAVVLVLALSTAGGTASAEPVMGGVVAVASVDILFYQIKSAYKRNIIKMLKRQYQAEPSVLLKQWQ